MHREALGNLCPDAHIQIIGTGKDEITVPVLGIVAGQDDGIAGGIVDDGTGSDGKSTCTQGS